MPQFDERLTIDTPEQITLELPLAGIGSRFLAIAIDTLLQVSLFLTGVIVLTILGGAAWGRPGAWMRQIGPALAVLLAFCLYWGYFAVFEIVWGGRTPGKRLAGIRVIKDSGRPINAYESIGRNVLRAVDFLPAMYAIGVGVMLLNRHSRRIGDFVAGTVVVYEGKHDGPAPNWQSADLVAGISSTALTRVTAEELRLIETYLQRRHDLDPLVRDEMAERIAARISQRIGIEREPAQ
ncbi:MAG TPA: RDD family protein, partial [Vicinamibacterales bacterium]